MTRANGQRYRDMILSRGGSDDPAALYRAFRGRDPVVEPLILFAARSRCPVVFHTGTYINSDVLAIAEVARQFPQTTFVCDCAGFTDMWFELPDLLAENQNIVLCASLIWGRAILNTIRAHGPGRVMFGSGQPRDSLAAALRRIDRLELTNDERRAVLFDNANRIFALGISCE